MLKGVNCHVAQLSQMRSHTESTVPLSTLGTHTHTHAHKMHVWRGCFHNATVLKQSSAPVFKAATSSVLHRQTAAWELWPRRARTPRRTASRQKKRAMLHDELRPRISPHNPPAPGTSQSTGPRNASLLRGSPVRCGAGLGPGLGLVFTSSKRRHRAEPAGHTVASKAPRAPEQR